MIKHYKVILLTLGVFVAFGVMPAERPHVTTLRNIIPNRVVVVPPPNLSEVEENNRKLHELFCELEWLRKKDSIDNLKK